jgi:hypothetical protein
MKRSIMKGLVWIAFCTTLLSFSKIGGHSYTIHLNEKQLVQNYVHSKEVTPNISLAHATANDQLFVSYNECGQVGKERRLSIRDEKDNVLKEWQFANSPDERSPMICKAKEILAVKKNSNSKLRLFYASREVSKGQLLATIDVADSLKARK